MANNDAFSDSSYRVPESVRLRIMAAQALQRTAGSNLGLYSSKGLAVAQGLLGLAGNIQGSSAVSAEEAAQTQSAQREASAWAEKYSSPAARALASSSGSAPSISPAAMAAALRNPSGNLGTPTTTDYLGRLAHVESTNNATISNPASGATGLYQFTAPTWAGLMRQYPNLGLTSDGRTDPTQQGRAIQAFTNDNASAIGRAGYDTTPGNLYLAHFAGAGGALSALKADPSTPVETVLGSAAVKANPFLRGKTAGDLIGWANGKMAGVDPSTVKGSPAPAVASATPGAPQLQNYTNGGAISDADMARYNSDRAAFQARQGSAQADIPAPNAAPVMGVGHAPGVTDAMWAASAPRPSSQMSADAAALLSPNATPTGLAQPMMLGNTSVPPGSFSTGGGDPMSAGRALNAGIDGTGIGANGMVPPPNMPAPPPAPMQAVPGPSGPNDPANATDYAMSPTGPRSDYAPAVSMGGLPPAGASDGPPNPVTFNPAMLGPQQGSPDGMGTSMLPPTAPMPPPGIQSPAALALLQGSGSPASALPTGLPPPPPPRTPQNQAAAQASFDAVRNPDGSLPHEFGGLHPNANPAGVVSQAGHAPEDAQSYADPSSIASTPAQQAIRNRLNPSADALALAGNAGTDTVGTSPMWSGGQGGNDPSSAGRFARSQGMSPAAQALLSNGAPPPPSISPSIAAQALSSNSTPAPSVSSNSKPNSFGSQSSSTTSDAGPGLFGGLSNLLGGGQQQQAIPPAPPGISPAIWAAQFDQRIDPATRHALMAPIQAPDKFGSAGDGQIYDKTTGKMVDNGNQAGSRPLNADERKAFNVPDGQVASFDRRGELHLAPPGTNVSVNTAAESSFEKGRGEGLAKYFNTMGDAGTAAQQDLANVDRFKDLLGTVKTGAGPAYMEKIRQLTGGAVSLDPNTSNVQALQAAIQYQIVNGRAAGSGVQTDQDAQRLAQAVPSLMNSPEGNQIILDSVRGMAQQKLSMAHIANQVRLGKLSPEGAQQQIDALPSPFPKLPDASSDALAQAKAAIANGAPRDKVIERLRSNNIDASGL